MRTALAATLAALIIATPAHALVLCARKVNGTIRVRETCRSNEFKLEPKLAGLAAVGGGSTTLTRTTRDVGTTVPALNVTALHAVDAADQDVGLIVSIAGRDFTVALDSGVLVTISTENDPPRLKVGSPGAVVWSDADCAGSPYVEASHVAEQGLIQGLFYVDDNQNSFYRIPGGATAAPTTAFRRDFGLPGAPCGPVSSATSAFVLESVTVPFTVPLAWPLRAQPAAQ